MVEPKCPSYGCEGLDHIVSEGSAEKSRGGDNWFNIAFCDQCGHVYGIFAKVVHSPTIHVKPQFP